MERTEETLKARVREAPLTDRLSECRKRIGRMCAEGRAPRMCIPVQHDDDDFFICTTLADAQATVEALQAQVDHVGDTNKMVLVGDYEVLAQRYRQLERQAEALQRERDEWKASCNLVEGVLKRDDLQKAALQSHLSTLQGLVETIKCELFDRYDGAPDSPTRWMGSLIRDIEIATRDSTDSILATRIRETTDALDAEREKVKGLEEIIVQMGEQAAVLAKDNIAIKSALSQLQALVRALPSGSSMMRTDFVNGKWRVWDDLGEATLLGEFKNGEHAQAYRAMVKHRATLPATPTEEAT